MWESSAPQPGPCLGQKPNVGAVFPIASRKLRATFFFPSSSKVITNGLTGNSSKSGCGRAVSNCVRLSRYYSREFSTRKPAYERHEAGETRRQLLTVRKTSCAAVSDNHRTGSDGGGGMMKTIHPLAIAAGASLPRVCWPTVCWPRVRRPLVFTFRLGTTKPSG